MSYMVMECHPGYVILLEEAGCFFKAANLQYEVGQTVYDPILMKDKAKEQRHPAVKWICSGTAAIAACFLLFFGFSYYRDYIQPYSSIYLTINPEVQMNLNRQGTVVELVGTNDDGKRLLDGYDGKGKDKITVADELIDRAIEMGFLSEGGQISFSIDSPDDVLFQEYGVELRTKVAEYLDGRITITLEIFDYQNSQAGNEQDTSAASSAQSTQPNADASNTTDYDDTDYGSDNNNVSSNPKAPSGNATSRIEASANNSTTDYHDGDTDYAPQDEEDTNYEEDDDDDDEQNDDD